MAVTMTRETDKRADDDAKRYPSELHRRQRAKNLAVAGVLAGLCVLFYLVAIVRMSGS
jgi:phage shock protein PspC (stress-responsive transcriptional regulator)